MQTHAHTAGPAHPRRLSPGAAVALERWSEPPRLEDQRRTKGEVVLAFRRAARYLGIRGNTLVLIDHLFALSQPQDWLGASRPIVWPSNDELGAVLGLGRTAVKTQSRRLLDLGLILDRSHGTGARRGYRTKDGQIAQASGFDLSPIAARVEEFIAVYEQGRAADRRRKDLLIRRTQALRGIGQLVRTAGEGGFDSDALYSLADRREAITQPVDRRSDEARLRQVAQDLEALHEEVATLFHVLAAGWKAATEQAHTSKTSPAVDTVSAVDNDEATSTIKENMNPMGADSRPPIYNYKRTNNLKDSNSPEQGSSEFGGQRSPDGGKRERPHLPTVRPTEMLRLAPVMERYVNQDMKRLDADRALLEMQIAGKRCAFDYLGVSPHLYGQAEQLLGGYGAAIAVMIVAAKNPDHFSRTSAHYFAGMLKAAARGELHLSRSVWALRDKLDATA